MKQAPLAQILKMGAFMWIVAGSFSSGILYAVVNDLGIKPRIWMLTLGLSMSATVLLVVAILFCIIRQWQPAMHWRNILVGIAFMSAFFMFAPASLAYLLAAPAPIRSYLWSAVIMATVWWCWIALAGYRQRIKDRRFIEREFSFEEDRIVVRQPLKTNLDPAPVGDETFFGRLYHNFGPYLVMGIPLAYPIQSLLFDAGGTAAVLLLLSILGLPLTLYILG